MPSSPEAAAWVPAELAGARVDGPAPQRREFVAAFAPAQAAAPAPAPFEVAGAHSVPAALLEPARRAAQAAGYAAGWARGLAAAQQSVREQASATQARDEALRAEARLAAERAVAAVTAAAARLDGRAAQTLDGAADAVVQAAFTLAETLVGTVLEDDALRGRAVVARALAACPDGPGAVTVHLNPVDLGVAASLVTPPAHVTLAADAALAPGDARVVAQTVTVEAGLADALARVRAVLDGPR